jgi:hypothetical protein
MRLLILLLSLALAASLAQAQMENELLLQNMPPGYKIGFQTTRGNMVMTEFVPEKESVENWTEMLTMQVFLGLSKPTPNEFRQVMQKLF